MTLVAEWRLGAVLLTDAPYLVAFGSDYGSPDSAADVLASFLTDGDIEVAGHVGNRTITLPILIEGSDLLEVSQAEAALVAEVSKAQNTLVVDPGDGYGPAFQFTVFAGSLAWNRDDVYEQRGFRSFTLTMRALPYAFSAVETVTPALAASGTTTVVVADGSSATNWTATANGTSVTPVVAGGAVVASTGSPVAGGTPLDLTYTASIPTSTTKYVMVDWRTDGGTLAVTGIAASAGSTALPLVSTSASPVAGYNRSWFLVGPGVSSLACVTFSVNSYVDGAAPTVASFQIDGLVRTDARPTLGSPKQQIRTLEVGGSAPTFGSLALEHATSQLGDVILYTCPEDGSGYVPALVGYRTTATTPDSSCVSGGYVDIGAGGASYSVPSASLANGEYAVMARMRSSSGATQTPVIRFAFTVGVGGTIVLPGGYINFDQSISIGTTHSFIRLAPGFLHLPYFHTEPTSSSVHFFTMQSSLPNIQLDELYLFNMTTGDLTQVACGAGAIPSRRLWVDSPTVDNEGLGNLIRGVAANRADAYSAYPDAVAIGMHEFPPGIVKVLSVATNPATAADASFRHRRAWLHTAAS